MPRPATGQILRREGGRGGGCYALRFRFEGRRRYITLGTVEDGWTDQKARDELDRVMEEVTSGTWRDDRCSSLSGVIQRVLDEATDEDLTDADKLAWQVLDRASADDLQWELHVLIKQMVYEISKKGAQKGTDVSSGRVAVDLNVIVRPAGDAKRLGSCTVADIDTLAYEQELRARELLEDASRWRSLGAEMRSANAATVQDLGAERAMEAMRRGNGYKVLRNDELRFAA